MQGYVRTKPTPALVAVVLLAVSLQGCVRQNDHNWPNTREVLMLSSAREIEEKFRTLLPAYTDNSVHFSITKVQAETSQFLFVTAYPYTGPAIFSVYCYEEINPALWHLRAVVPIIEAHMAAASFAADGNSVKVICDGEVILKVGSVAAAVRKEQARPVPH